MAKRKKSQPSKYGELSDRERKEVIDAHLGNLDRVVNMAIYETLSSYFRTNFSSVSHAKDVEFVDEILEKYKRRFARKNYVKTAEQAKLT